MYEIDRAAFGAFVARLRKERAMTQKELAQRLYVSDKAVSKWERGLSLPDVALLIPLAEALGVTVTELLEGRRLETEPMAPDDVEALVKKAIRLSEAPSSRGGPDRRRQGLFYAAALVLAAAGTAALLWAHWFDDAFWSSAFLIAVLSAVFGGYFCLLAPSALPWYHDVSDLSFVYDGPFRMNVPGVRFNNRNWPHVTAWMRRWCLWSLALAMPLYALVWRAGLWGAYGLLGLWLAGLFLCIYIAAKRYE